MTQETQPPDVLEPGLAAVVEPEALEQLEEVEPDAPLVGVIVEQHGDLDALQPAIRVLDEAGVRSEVRVMAAHHEAEAVADYCRNARMRGLRVLIAGAALSAALPGIAASHTDLPVIGVPLSNERSAAGGLDAILGVAQTPSGVPVACVGLDAAENAGHLALRILS